MSDSIIGKENISYRKLRVPETTQGPSCPQSIQFAHKFTGGETSFSLLSLTTPTAELPGFTNPSPAVLAGTGLNANPNALRLTLSSAGQLIPYNNYRVYGTTVVFVGALGSTGVPAGAVIFGEVTTLAPNPLVVGDGRFIRKSYTLASGQATLNLGFAYKIGVGLGAGDQIGEIKVYRGGVLQMRNVGNATAAPGADGNYQEVDAGNGYGTSITFNAAASGQDEAIIVEMGYQLSSGNLQIWSELERLQGALYAIATDAAVGFGNPISNYLSANATELERRAFGDQVFSHETRVTVLENKKTEDLRMNTLAGHGSTNNKIPYYTNTAKNTLSTLATMQNSATLGFSVTMLKRCKVTMAATLRCDDNNMSGISLNSTQLTTTFDGVNVADRLAVIYTATGADGSVVGPAVYAGILEPGDVVRPHTQGNSSTAPTRYTLNFLAEEI